MHRASAIILVRTVLVPFGCDLEDVEALHEHQCDALAIDTYVGPLRLPER